MSRFSRSEAEKAGWSIFHEQDKIVLNDGDNQAGTSRVLPASYRAEKYVSLPGRAETLITEEAHSIGKLLERIHAYEEHLKSRREPEEPVPPVPDVEIEDGRVIEGDTSVTLPSGKSVSEAEWVGGQSKDVREAVADRLRLKQDEENKRIDLTPEPGEVLNRIAEAPDAEPQPPGPDADMVDVTLYADKGEEDLESLNVRQLRKLAKERGIKTRARKKKNLIAALEKAAK